MFLIFIILFHVMDYILLRVFMRSFRMTKEEMRTILVEDKAGSLFISMMWWPYFL